MKRYAEYFKALGDETRLRILCLLVYAESGLCVCELTDALEIPQYNISRHLKILKNAGLVEERKEGRWVYFSPKKNDSFTQSILNSIRFIPSSLFSRDLQELDKLLSIRAEGKCLLGIQKKHLKGIPAKKTASG